MDINDFSIAELEQSAWEDSDYPSYVVQKSQAARKKPISQLSHEEIRLLIGQKIGLQYVVPIALSILRENPMIAVHFYEGDLLLQMLRLSEFDWENLPAELHQFRTILRENLPRICACDEIPKDLLAKYPG